MSRSSGDDYILSGDQLIYYVCEIEGETKSIGFDGDKIVVWGEEYNKEEYSKFRRGEKELTELQENLMIPEKKMSHFRSQLPSYTHLQNLYKQGMSRREELWQKDPEELTDDELIEWRIQHSEYRNNTYLFEDAVLDEIYERNLHDRLREEFKEKLRKDGVEI